MNGLDQPVESAEVTWIHSELPAVRGRIAEAEGFLLLDTAAGLDLVDRALCDRVSCTPAGTFTGTRHTGERVTLELVRVGDVAVGARRIADATVGALPLPAELRGADVIGAISLAFFAHHPVTLDLPHDRLIFESRATMAECRRGRGLPLHLRRTGAHGLDAFVDVVVRNTPALMEVDSASTAIIVNRRLLKAPPDDGGPMHLEVRPAHAPELGARLPVYSAEAAIDGLLGLPYLRRTKFTVDLENRMLWIGS